MQAAAGDGQRYFGRQISGRRARRVVYVSCGQQPTVWTRAASTAASGADSHAPAGHARCPCSNQQLARAGRPREMGGVRSKEHHEATR